MKLSVKKIKVCCFIGIFLVALSVLTVSVFEIGFRLNLYRKICERNRTACLWIQNQPIAGESELDKILNLPVYKEVGGLFKSKTTFSISVVHPTLGNMNYSVRSNNRGLLSDHDYFERDPKNKEYRIVILGESFTAPTTATYQWVDTLENLLNQKIDIQTLGVKKIKVYNVSCVGAGFPNFLDYHKRIGLKLDPDLVIVNYTDVDWPRTEGAHLADQDMMFDQAAKCLRQIKETSKKFLITLMPTYWDLIPEVTQDKNTVAFMKKYPEFIVHILKNRMPLAKGEEFIEKWYSVPWDAHMSDLGGEFYARAMAGFVAQNLGQNILFNDVMTPNLEKLIKLKKRNLPVQTDTSLIADNAEKTQRIRENILALDLKRIFSLSHLFYLDYIFGSKTDGMAPPLTSKLHGYYYPIPYADSPDSMVYLAVTSTNEKDSKRKKFSKTSYHHFHLFSGLEPRK